MSSKDVPHHRAAEGWWQQQGIGKRSMDLLRILVSSASLHGSGMDCIGLFTFEGSVEDGKVMLMKHYLGKHAVQYLGAFDGERRLWGTWHLEGMQGPWEILLRDGEHEQDAESAVQAAITGEESGAEPAPKRSESTMSAAYGRVASKK